MYAREKLREFGLNLSFSGSCKECFSHMDSASMQRVAAKTSTMSLYPSMLQVWQLCGVMSSRALFYETKVIAAEFIAFKIPICLNEAVAKGGRKIPAHEIGAYHSADEILLLRRIAHVI